MHGKRVFYGPISVYVYVYVCVCVCVCVCVQSHVEEARKVCKKVRRLSSK